MTFVSKWLIGLCFEEQCDTIDRECHNHISQPHQIQIEQIATRYDSNQSALGILFNKLFEPLSNIGVA